LARYWPLFWLDVRTSRQNKRPQRIIGRMIHVECCS
jgi:hypothetical protein